MADLFTPAAPAGLTHLPGFAQAGEAALLAAVEGIAAAAPFRQMITPGGKAMSVGITNCGAWGWVSDRRGYRYAEADPLTGLAWPAMPEIFARLATRAAARAGFENFTPDACLINRYAPGARMSLHQDHDELDFTAPIVSVSLGLPAVFLWGGASRADRPEKLPLQSGDVVVWGGPHRQHYHGVAPIKPGGLPARYNLTFRKAK